MEALAQLVQRHHRRLYGSVESIEDPDLVRISVQRHFEDVECDLLQRMRQTVERIAKAPPRIFMLVLEQEVEQVHAATIPQ